MKIRLFAFFLCSVGFANAQNQPVDLSNNPGRHAHGFSTENDDLPARNHGTGVRAGSSWSLTRTAAQNRQLPRSFEVGVFHQVPLSRIVSLQGEALYYRAATPAGSSSGLRLPALLVINPFYNVSVHIGPQLQLWTRGTAIDSNEAVEMPLSELVVPAA